MAPRKNCTDLAKKLKKKEYDRLRRLKLKNDPESLRELRLKEQLKYQRKLEKKQVKPVSDMTAREQREHRKIWRARNKKWYYNKKAKADAERTLMPAPSSAAATPPQPSTNRMQHILKSARKRKRQNRSKLQARIKKLEHDNKQKQRIIERLRKRGYRAKLAATSSSSSPKSLMNKIIKTENKKQIARRLLFGETVCDSLEEYYKSLTKREKPRFRESYIKSARFLRKYRLIKNVNFLSSRLFNRKAQDMTNSGLVRMKMKKISEKVKMDVIRFIEDDSNSIMCPGKRDCITRRKIKKQKRYLSATMLDLHSKFCEETTAYKISYSTFCSLKPFWVVPRKVTARDTCACRICENMQLMVSSLYKGKVLETNKLSSIVNNICCDTSSLACLQRNCSNCKKLEIPYQLFDEGELSYDQWTTKNVEVFTKGNSKKIVKHVVKATIISTVLATVDLFEEKMKHYMHHEAIRLHQFRELKNVKARLAENEVIIHCDFSENYTMKYGQEIQSVHFGGSRQQFSLHTVQIYFRKNVYEEVQSLSFCTLSESNNHGPAAVWAHLKPIFDYIAVNLQNVDTVHFQSDSPATQYRNRTIFYLLANALEVYITKLKFATWNYSAPGHGKGAVDGIGGCLKQTADTAVACGQDISSFETFVEVLKKKKNRNVLLYVIAPEDISGISSLIPKLLPFKGTMQVYQVVYHRNGTAKRTFKMNRLSCFDCLKCNKFTIGFHDTNSGVTPSNTLEVENKTLEGTSGLHPCSLLDTVMTCEPEAHVDSQPQDLLITEKTPTVYPYGQPKEGSYVIARFDGSKEYRYVCCLTSVRNNEITALGLHSIQNSKRDFILNANGQFSLRASDILMELPAPKVKIQNRRMLRVFPFDLEVVEKE